MAINIFNINLVGCYHLLYFSSSRLRINRSVWRGNTAISWKRCATSLKKEKNFKNNYDTVHIRQDCKT